MKKIIPILVALSAISPAFGRDITGKIIGENNEPVDFANVVLYCDSTYIAGGISDESGNFAVATESECNLSVRISFVGYETFSASVPSSGDMG